MSDLMNIDTAVKTYLINAINLYDCDIDDSEMDVSDKLTALESIFMSEVGDWDIPRVGRQKALQGWLQGLPTPLKIDFHNHDIITLAVQWGIIQEKYTYRQADRVIRDYWKLLASKLCQLFDGYHIPKGL